MYERRGGFRVIAGMLAGALALSVSPLLGLQAAGAADPLPPLADPTKAGAFCDGAPTTNPFTDLGAESAATRQVILCLVATELTAGTSADTFTPGGTVTRRQMALFIKRLADLLEGLESTKPGFPPLPAYDNVPDYTDVAAEGPAFREAIGQLSQAEIVGGFPDNTFRPGLAVSRRQMAAFVNRLQDFLSSAPFTTTKNYFDDDNGDSGEANLNALASVGIFQGDGQGRVFPGASLTRRQMANILLRDAQVYLGLGAVNRPFAPVPATGSFPVTPTDLQTVAQNATRDFTATNLDSTKKYDIAIFKCANAKVDGDKRFTFTAQGDSSPNNTKADRGAPTAALTKVNGVDSTSGDGVAPTSANQITFTLRSTATECVRPIVFADTGDDDTLNLNPATKQATDPFGGGGETQFIPAQSPGNVPAGNTVSLVGPGYAVVESGTVFFRQGDDYALASTSGPPTTLSSSEFFQRLSTGDGLRSCNLMTSVPAPYSQTAANDFCLTDSAPNNPANLTAAAGTPADTTVDLEWAAATPADAYNVYRNPEACSNTTDKELTKTGTVAATKTKFTVTGLIPDTTYCFVVTTVENGDESTFTVGADTNQAGQANTTNNVVERKTSAPIKAPTIVSAAIQSDTGTVGTATIGDVFVLTFSEAMDPTTVSGATFSVTDANDDTTTFTCGASPAPNTGVTAANCSLGDGVNATVVNDTLTVTLTEAGDDANSAGANNGIQYALRITASTVLKDANNGLTVDVPGSTDLLIN